MGARTESGMEVCGRAAVGSIEVPRRAVLVEAALCLVSNKWKALILRDLFDRPQAL